MATALPTRKHYDESTVDLICQRLRAGESLLRISKDPTMPSQRTLSEWVAKNYLGFAEKYLDAKRVAAHFLAEKALEEAFNATDDFYLDDEGRPVFDGHHVQRSKLIVDTIKWEVSKMLPKLYGDKLTQEFDVSGDLVALIESASNRDSGLPPPIDGEFDEVTQTDVRQMISAKQFASEEATQSETIQHDGFREPQNGPSTPSNHRHSRRRRQPTN